jgi:hypothetical protein
MGKRKIAKRKVVKSTQSKSLIRFVVVGLVHDLLSAFKALIKVFSWPINSLSHVIHVEAKKHPSLKVLHSRAFISFCMGFTVLAISFSVEHLFKHVLWDCSIETMRAAGVCPIWDIVSNLTQTVGKEG